MTFCTSRADLFLSNYFADNVLYTFGSNLYTFGSKSNKTEIKAVSKTIRMVLWKLHDFKPGKMSLHVPWKSFRKCDLLRFCGEALVARKLETVLGIQIDNKLNFENHIKPLKN